MAAERLSAGPSATGARGPQAPGPISAGMAGTIPDLTPEPECARCHGDETFLPLESIDWQAVRAAAYEVRQSIRYEYPGPIDDLRQLLMLVPPDRIDGQRLLCHELQVTPPAHPRYSSDRFGNRVCAIAIPRVEGALEFAVRLRVERRADAPAPTVVPGADAPYRLPSPLTEPTPELEQAAAALGPSEDPRTLADAINDWVYRHLQYTPGVTGVRTTAQDALALGQGVCQDYAHLMIALCRIRGLAARYVSGHLLGEGAMHAWVQVLLPSAAGGASAPMWQSFDPTHGRRAGMQYITVAVGRDYGDVSPTRGSFRAPYEGWLAGGARAAGVLRVAP